MGRKLVIDLGGKKKSKKNLQKGLAIGAAAGTALGALAGILFAPKSGKETRDDIKDTVVSGTKTAAEEIKKVGQTISEEAKKAVAKLNKKHIELDEESNVDIDVENKEESSEV